MSGRSLPDSRVSGEEAFDAQSWAARTACDKLTRLREERDAALAAVARVYAYTKELEQHRHALVACGNVVDDLRDALAGTECCVP